jgi:hypothetical protein
VYASDPDIAPDSEFEPGQLRHLVPGNRGRLLDARRTPITVTGLVPERAAFVVEVGAFEDAGARWELPLEDIGSFQFARGEPVAGARTVAELERAVARFDRQLQIDCDPDARERSLHRIATERANMRTRLESADRDAAARIAARQGDPRLFNLLEEVVNAHGVGELERDFSTAFVSNPRSGEQVKGHAIVLAELGLCPFRGKVVRDPGLFDGAWSRARRSEHLITRLAFTQELWSSRGEREVVLYRGAAVDGSWPERAPASFTSATFSAEVATEHFAGGPATHTAVLWRQRMPIARLFMTFLETRAMNGAFHEAEAVLIGDPGNRAF